MQSEEEKNRLRVLSQQNNIPLRVAVPTTPPATPLRVSTPYTPPAPTIPQYSSLGARLKDVILDANTPQDIAKRLAKGEPASYAEQQRQLGVSRPDQNVLQALFREPLTFGATQRDINRIALTELPRLRLAQLTGNKQAQEAARKRIEDITTGVTGTKAFGVPSAFGQKELGEDTGLGKAAIRFGGAALGTGAFAIGGGPLVSFAKKEATKQGAKLLSKEGLKQLAKFTLTEGAAGAAGNVGALLTRRPEATGQEIAVSAGLGAGLGAPLAIGTGLLGNRITGILERPAGRTLTVRLAEETDEAAIRGAVRELLPEVAEEELDTLAARIASSNNPTEIENIIINAAEQITPTRVPTPEPTPTPTPAVQAVTENLARQTDVNQIRQTVQELFPALDENGQLEFSQRIAAANTPEAVEAVLDQADEASRAITQAIEEATPPAPVTTGTPIEQATEQPVTAPTRVSTGEVAPAPATTAPTTTQPAGVSGAAPATTVPGTTAPNKIGIQNINEKTVFYHGTQGPINKISELNESYGTLNNLFGPGIYLTDNPNIASGYQTTRGANVQAGKVLSGTISDAKLFNLENILPKDLADVFTKQATIPGEFNDVPDFANMTGIEAIREIKKYVGDQYEFDDFFTQKVQPLLKEKGYDGLYHIGGVQGGEKHNVAILFEKTKLKDLPPVSPTQAAPTEAVQGAIESLPERLVAQAEAQQQRYAPTGFLQRVKEVWDPRSSARKIDARFAKEIQGVKYGDLRAIDRLEAALMRSAEFANEAQEFLADSNIAKVIQKYKPNTPEGNAFNTYRLFMRDLEQIADGRPVMIRDISEAEKLAFVQQFEAANPTARQDLRAMVQDIEALQNITAEGKDAFISKADLDAARTKKDGTRYQFFTPVERAMPEEVERAMVNSRNIGTLGQQRILRDFTGSNIPIDPTYNSITDYVTTVFKQLGQSRVIKLFKERVEQGVVEGAEFIQTPEDFIKMERLKANFTELKNVSDALKKEIRRVVTETKVAREQVKTEIAKLKTADLRQAFNLKNASKEAQQRIGAAVTRGKELLTRSLDPTDVDSIAAVNALNDEELLDLLDFMTQGELFVKPPTGKAKLKAAESAQARAARAAETTKSQQAAMDRIAKKGDNFARLVDRVSDLRMDLQVIDNNRRGIRQELIDLRTDPTTGLQTVLGKDANGIPFRIEVTPEYARLLQGFNQGQTDEMFRLGGVLTQPIRTALTGIINPAFQISQATWNAVLTPLLSKDGLRVYSKDAVEAALKSFNRNSDFQKLLRANGASAYSGTYRSLVSDTTAEAIAAQSDLLSKAKWNANPKRAWDKLGELGGKLDNAARTGAAEAAYQRVLREGGSKEAALAEAIYARTQVLPDYRNMHKYIRGADNLLMYTGAAQVGMRVFARALRERPLQTVGKLGGIGAFMAAGSAYSLAHDNGEAFYKDMVDSKKEYILDNNVIIVLPGAKKDEKTGEWTGVIKYGLPNELRPLNKAIRSTIYSGQPGIPLKTYAMSLFDFMTGNIKDSTNPAFNVAASIATGKDPNTGREIYDQTMDNTQKRDAILRYVGTQFGVPGKLAVSDQPAKEFIDSFVNRVYGAKGSTEATRYFQNQDKAIQKAGLNRNELEAYYGTVAPRSKDLTGNSIKDKTYYDSASRATTYLRYPKTFEVSKEIDRLARQQGKPGDPLFDLPADRLQVVLNMQANFSPGNFEDQAMRRLNPWLDDYNKARSEYFNKVLSEEQKKAGGVDPMGITVPKASPEVSSKLDRLKSLTQAERAQFYADNPEVSDFFAKQDDYERVKREFLGLPQFDSYPTPNKEVQGYINEYNALPSKNGPLKKDGTPSSPDRSAWIQANPDKWSAMTEQWTLQDIYRLQKEGALAVYEGIDFSEQGIKSLLDIAKSLGYSQGTGFGGFGGTGLSRSQAFLEAISFLRQLETGIRPLSIVSAAPRRVRLQRVRVPTTRRAARIRLR